LDTALVQIDSVVFFDVMVFPEDSPAGAQHCYNCGNFLSFQKKSFQLFCGSLKARCRGAQKTALKIFSFISCLW